MRTLLLILLLFFPALLAAQTIDVEADVTLEAWPADAQDYYQHRADGEITLVFQWRQLRVDGFVGLGWWGRPDAKLPSSFLNLEATRTLERRHGIDVAYAPFDWFLVGASLRRRGVD
jgi:hypothetical protein